MGTYENSEASSSPSAQSTLQKSSSSAASSVISTQPTDTDIKTVTCPCQIMIVEVKGEADLKRGGKISTPTKGQILEVGDEIYVGENSQVAVVFINCGFGANADDVGIALIQSGQKGKITNENGKPAVALDPGVAKVSVKSYPQFQTDFQVSTPRLTCSVRG